MAFEELQEKLKSEWQQTVDRLNDNPAFVALKDRFENLSPGAQKGVIAGGVAVVVLIFGMMPYNGYMLSSDTMTEFEDKRALMRDLQRTHRDAQSTQGAVRPPTVNDVRSRIENIVAGAQLLPDQQRGVTTLNASGSLVRDSLVGGIIQVNLAQLNLRQITSLGTDMSGIQGAKLKDVVMEASQKDNRYYDVVFRVLVFKGSAEENSADEPPAPRGGRGR